jgi:hypothetical protein
MADIGDDGYNPCFLYKRLLGFKHLQALKRWPHKHDDLHASDNPSRDDEIARVPARQPVPSAYKI